MQIREINLKEIDTIYDVVKELHKDISYQEFEDLIYDMRHIEYTMLGIFEKNLLITYAGVAIITTLKDSRHLRVFDFITSNKYNTNKYNNIMKEYIADYAKVAMCEKVKYEN